MKVVYVLVHNGGCEGHSPPFQAFESLEAARGATALIRSAAAYSFEVYEVPVWPVSQDQPYYNLKPVDLKGSAE